MAKTSIGAGLEQANVLLPLAGYSLENPWNLTDGLPEDKQLESLAVLAESVGKILLAYATLWRAMAKRTGDAVPFSD
jgi:hypothetical protein